MWNAKNTIKPCIWESNLTSPLAFLQGKAIHSVSPNKHYTLTLFEVDEEFGRWPLDWASFPVCRLVVIHGSSALLLIDKSYVAPILTRGGIGARWTCHTSMLKSSHDASKLEYLVFSNFAQHSIQDTYINRHFLFIYVE